jgi:tetratricopeptide (TPR) repeat protein
MRWVEATSQNALYSVHRGDLPAAKRFLDAVTKKFDGLKVDEGENSVDRELSAVVRSNMAECAKVLDDTKTCVHWLDGAIDDLKILVTRYPARPKYKKLLARCLGQVAENRNFLEFASDAERDAAYVRSLSEFEQAIELMHSLIAAKYADQVLDSDLCATLGAYGDWLQKGKRYEEAVARYEEATKILDRRLAANPDSPEDRRNIAENLTGLGYCRSLLDEGEGALESIARSASILTDSHDKKLLADSEFGDLFARNRLVLADYYLNRRDHRETLAAMLDLEKIDVPIELRFDCIRKLNFSIEDASTDGAISETDRKAAIAKAAAIAVTHLDAILAGGGSVDVFRDEPKYGALRDTAEFAAWAAKHP